MPHSFVLICQAETRVLFEEENLERRQSVVFAKRKMEAMEKGPCGSQISD